MSEEKFDYEAMFIGRPAQFERFTKGSWTPVTEKEARYYAKKLDFKVRDTKGHPIDEAFFLARNAKEQSEAMRTYAQREREAERLSSRTSLKPNGKQGPVPHDEGYVPQEGALDASDGLPPAGFEYVEGAARKAIKGVLPSQRFDPALSRELSTLRLSPKDDPSLAFNLGEALAGTRAELAERLNKTPTHQISRAG
jgi:hypothetical protein